MYESLHFNQLLSFNSRETLVLTVNNRFARRLLSQLHSSLQGQKKAIAVPDIMPLTAWLQQASDDLSFNSTYAPASYLLDAFSSLYVWEQTIYADESEQAVLIDVPQAAKMAADADSLINEWALVIDEQTQTSDSEHFLAWREAYVAYLKQHDLDDVNRSTERVLLALQEQAYQPRWRHIVLVGFHEYSVRFQQLLSALEAQGIEIYTYTEALSEPATCTRIIAPTPDAEWRLAARWAAEQLQQSPTGRFAIIATDLQTQAAFAHRVLAHELSPGSTEHAGFSWNIAVGRSLSAWPLVAAALAWLRALAESEQGAISCAVMGKALLVGYCGAEQDERDGRAQLDVLWRKNQQIVVKAEAMHHTLHTYSPQLAEFWSQAVAYLKEQPDKASPSAWVPHLRHVLELLGFPGEGNLDSHAYQTLQALDQRLGQFSRLAPIFGQLSLAQVVSMLARFLKETLFQPQRSADARLDVLGLLEAEGGHWDGVWVLGLTDDVLPAVPNPNPFIPYAVLKQAQAPRATPERELQWAKNMLQSVQQTSTRLVFSHAEQNNGQLLRPSPLIVELASCISADPLTVENTMAVVLECMLDQQGPAVTDQEKLFGGVALLDHQARNPLWAFVQHRLHATALPVYEDSGTMSLWRGMFLHEALELFWGQMAEKDQLHLVQVLASGQFDQYLDEAIAQAALKHLQVLNNKLRELECLRAKKVLVQWLQLEAERPYFKIVAQEQLHQLPGIGLNMRIDRIDQLADGSFLLIDYKTGRPATPYKAWLRDRPIELQLPIYTAILEQQAKPVAGMAFAYVHYQALLAGYGNTQDTGIQQPAFTKQADDYIDWSVFVRALAQQVNDIRDEFLQGQAVNRFLHLDDLAYCDVLPFLRLNQESMDDLS